jgi:farnesyl-diphosphate farnesyltransferase
MPPRRTRLPKGLLKSVSRSFYLTLRILPCSIRHQISLAYLLARTTDTVADTRLVPLDLRFVMLREMQNAILRAAEGTAAPAPDFSGLSLAGIATHTTAADGERILLENFHKMLEQLRSMNGDDRRRIRDLLGVIIRGQELDLLRFGGCSANEIVALESDAQLEEYAFLVAGSVGEFWTKMCLAHVIPRLKQNELFLLENGICFGKGLQLVNILRDLPGDLRQGRCYLPSIRLSEYGLTPRMLLEAASMDRFRPVYDIYLKRAEELLRAGWKYTNAIPQKQIRIRLACAWPILIGMRTLQFLRAGNVLDNQVRIKVDRQEVQSLILRSIVCYPSTAAWDQLLDRVDK